MCQITEYFHTNHWVYSVVVQNSRCKMVKLHCNCLNISIEAQGGDLKELNGASFLTNSSSDEFFKGKIFEIHLAVGGIQKVFTFIYQQNNDISYRLLSHG